jgi:hypothetical protein
LFLAPAAVTLVSQELIALFGLLLAGALPTMILTATILRAGAFSPKRVGQYAAALEEQLSFWFALFIWALLACLAVTASKVLWNGGALLTTLIPAVEAGRLGTQPFTIEWVRLADAILAASAFQVVIRLLPMLRGLRSLLRLNSTIAKEEAVEKALQQTSGGRRKAAEVEATPGHGSVVED